MSEKKGRSRFVRIFALFLLPLFSLSQNQSLIELTCEDFDDYSRVVVSSSVPLSFYAEKLSSSLQVSIVTKTSFRIRRESVRSRLIKSFSWAKTRDAYLLNIETKTPDFSYDYFILENPFRLIIDFKRVERKSIQQETAQPESVISQESRIKTFPSSSGERTESKMSEPLPPGIKTIVIDPGHGGIENGAKGKSGTLEKDITLAIALKLKAIIERNLAFRVVLTRDKDIDVSLENRAALANNNDAAVFISIHANGSYRKNAHGSETFFLSLNATDEETRRLAYLENRSSEFDEQIEEENKDEIAMILWDMAQSAYIKQSSQLAELIQKELNVLLQTTNRGIKQALFKVLTGVACPAVLVEVAFISNPDEEKQLVDEQFQVKFAQAIYRALISYIRIYVQ